MSKKPKSKLKEAIDILFQDYIKDIIKSLLTFLGKIVWNVYGATVLLILSTLLVGLISWLQIPITLPAYVVGIGIVTTILGVLIFQRLRVQPRLGQSNIIHEEMLWVVDSRNNILGPLCLICKEEMIVANDQDANVTNVFFGQSPEYVFTCQRGHQVKRNRSKSEIMKSVQSQLNEKSKRA